MPIARILCLLLAVPMSCAAAINPRPGPKAPALPEHPVTGPACATSAAPSDVVLSVGKSMLVKMPEPVANRSLGNPAVAQAMLVAPDTLYIVGVDLGSTNVIVQGRSGACRVLEVRVEMDVAAMQAVLTEALPDEHDIHVRSLGDALVLTGVVSDIDTAQKAQDLALAFVRRPLRSLQSKKNDEADPQNRRESASTGDQRVVNLLSIKGAQQVMLEVRVAEVSKSLIEKLEAGSALKLASGSWVVTAGADFISRTLHGGVQAVKSNGNRVGFDAQNENGLVRVLAEPTVMAISGQEGSFLAGGKFYIPVSQDATNHVSLQEKEFGIGLRFRPTVLGGGRINLYVAPEVSELSREGVGISFNSGFAPVLMPVVTTRRATTTVQLHDGQSFAIGGLIKNNITENVKAFPILGEIPVLGALFRSTDYQNDRTELVFVVTPHIVKALDAPPALPTDKNQPASPAELMLNGRVEH